MSILRVLLIVGLIVGACDASLPPVRFPDTNDPVPLPDDLAAQVEDWLFGADDRLEPIAPTAPAISAERAVEIAGPELVKSLQRNRVPDQDPSAPDGLVRRRYFNHESGATDVWVVAYRFKLGWDCQHPDVGGPGPCQAVWFCFVDDRTGEVVQSFLVAF